MERCGNVSSNGTFSWAVDAGGKDAIYGAGIATGGAGAVYVTGGFKGTAKFGGHTLVAGGIQRLFAARLTSASGAFQWVVAGSGTKGDRGHGIAADGAGNSYVTGSFAGTVTYGASSITSPQGPDVLVLKVGSH